MKQIEKILHFFLDFLKEWITKRNTGSVSIVVHFINGDIKRAFVEQNLSVPSDITQK